MQNLKDAIPTALNKQKESTDNRLKEVNTELKSLKTLITQRMAPAAPSPAQTAGTSSYLRPSVSGNTPGSAPSSAPTTPAATSENTEAKTDGKAPEEPKKDYSDYAASLNRSSPFGSGAPPAKASIPAWQMAMAAKKNEDPRAGSSSSADKGGGKDGAGGSGKHEEA